MKEPVDCSEQNRMYVNCEELQHLCILKNMSSCKPTYAPWPNARETEGSQVSENRVAYGVDYEQSLFPLRDSRGKQTSERSRKLPASLKRDARVKPLRFRTRSLVRFPRLSLSGKRDCS